MNTVLIKKQTKSMSRSFYSKEYKHYITVKAEIRYDDECGNGHNTFGITGEIWHATKAGNIDQRYGDCISAGCIHEHIVDAFPSLEPFIKWHLVRSNEPLHYVSNSMYWAAQGNLENARKSAIWTDAQLEDFTEEKLKARLPQLMNEFKKDIESLGFVF